MDTQTKTDTQQPYTTLPNLVDPTADKGIFEENYLISCDMVDDADLEGARLRHYFRPCYEPRLRHTPVMDLEFQAPVATFNALLAKELRPENVFRILATLEGVPLGPEVDADSYLETDVVSEAEGEYVELVVTYRIRAPRAAE
jgi:hypothetical protein